MVTQIRQETRSRLENLSKRRHRGAFKMELVSIVEGRGGVATVGSNSLPKRPCPTSALRFPVTSCALPVPNPSDRSPRGWSPSGLVVLNLLRFLWLFALGERYLVDCIKCPKLRLPHQRTLSRICWKEKRMRQRCALRFAVEFFNFPNLRIFVGLENAGD